MYLANSLGKRTKKIENKNAKGDMLEMKTYYKLFYQEFVSRITSHFYSQMSIENLYRKRRVYRIHLEYSSEKKSKVK